MKTPKEWSENLKSGIITDEMLEAALFSLNKRAKNCRDQKQSYKHSRYRYAEATSANYEAQMERYYTCKSSILSHIKPICIHKELLGFEKTRHYDYEKKFDNRLVSAVFGGRVCWSNCYVKRNHNWEYDDYYDDYNSETVWFFDEIDLNKPIFNYYLFYVVGNHSFHEPISEDALSKYNLPVFEIGKITTFGAEIDDLCSVQFAEKICRALENGEATIVSPILTNDEYIEYMQEEEWDRQTSNHQEYIDKVQEGYIETALSEWGSYISGILYKAVKNIPVPDIERLNDTESERQFAKTYVEELREDCERLNKEIHNEIVALNNDRNKYNIDSPKSCRKFLKRAKKIRRKIDSVFGNKEIDKILKDSIETFVDEFCTTFDTDSGYIVSSVSGVNELAQCYLETRMDELHPKKALEIMSKVKELEEPKLKDEYFGADLKWLDRICEPFEKIIQNNQKK